MCIFFNFSDIDGQLNCYFWSYFFELELFFFKTFNWSVMALNRDKTDKTKMLVNLLVLLIYYLYVDRMETFNFSFDSLFFFFLLLFFHISKEHFCLELFFELNLSFANILHAQQKKMYNKNEQGHSISNKKRFNLEWFKQ